MRMKMPLRVLTFIRRRLMESHRVGKRNSEYAVVGGNDLLQNGAKLCDLCGAEFCKRSHVPPAAQQHFERPHRPERDQPYEALVTAHHPSCLTLLQPDIVAEQAGSLFFEILSLRIKFADGLFR